MYHQPITKMRKFIIAGIISVIAVGIAMFILLGRYTDRVIDPYVRSLLEHTRPMGHKIDYKRIRVNLLQRHIVIKQVRLFPDSSLTPNDLRIQVNVKDIELQGFSLREMLFHRKLVIGDLLIEDPEVIITLPDEAAEVVREVREKDEKPKEEVPLLNQIVLNRIVLSGGSFMMQHKNLVLARSAEINLLAHSIALARDNQSEPIGFTYGEVLVELNDIGVYSETALYDISLGSFSLAKSDSTVILEDFKMIPKYDKQEFSGKLEFQNDRFDLNIGVITIGRVGIERFLYGGPLEIGLISIDSLRADIYRDKNVPFDFNRYPVFYNESFLKLSVPVTIDSILIDESRIVYGELAEGRSEAGTIALEDFRMQSYDLTNITEGDSLIHAMELHVQAKVMGEGNLNVKLTMQLEGDLRDIRCQGSVGAMNLAPLNNMLEPSINIKFNGGRVDRMTFDFNGNDRSSYGWMEFLYKDLNVELLKKDSEKQWGFISNLANAVAVSNNPHEGKEIKIVEIGYERDKNKGIINYIWKTIQSGMVRTILPTGKYQINKEQAREKNKLNRQIDKKEKKLEKEDQQTEKAKSKTLKERKNP